MIRTKLARFFESARCGGDSEATVATLLVR